MPKTAKTTHSPLPWSVCGSGKCSCKMIWSETADTHVATGMIKTPVACVHGEWGDDKDTIYGENLNVEANAKFIVKAVNLHAKLVEALEAEHRYPIHSSKKCDVCALLKEAKK